MQRTLFKYFDPSSYVKIWAELIANYIANSSKHLKLHQTRLYFSPSQVMWKLYLFIPFSRENE